jgi:aconitase A
MASRPPFILVGRSQSTVDANAQMALLQFMTTGQCRVRVSTSVHTDHLITARDGAERDLSRAIDENKEVYDFLESCCAKVSCPATYDAYGSTESASGSQALGSCTR